GWAGAPGGCVGATDGGLAGGAFPAGGVGGAPGPAGGAWAAAAAAIVEPSTRAAAPRVNFLIRNSFQASGRLPVGPGVHDLSQPACGTRESRCPQILAPSEEVKRGV